MDVFYSEDITIYVQMNKNKIEVCSKFELRIKSLITSPENKKDLRLNSRFYFGTPPVALLVAVRDSD